MVSLRSLAWCFTLAPLIQARTILNPRVDQATTQPATGECKPPVDQNTADQQNKVKCVDYSTCSIKGLEYWNTLQTTLLQPQICDRDDQELFEEHYFAEYDTSYLPDPDISQALQDRGVELTKMDTWQVSGLDPVTLARDPRPAYYNVFDTHNGIVVADGNWKVEDSQNVLQWSEIIYNTWQLAAKNADTMAARDKSHLPGGPISTLQSVIQHIITNKVTRAVTTAAYQSNGWTPGYDGPEQWRPWTEQNTRSFFFGLMGTDNVKGTVWLLNDHAEEIGRKEISTIWTRWSMGGLDIW
ncbi:MAG: hypothetical protein Q9168_004530 [Polycauliona sp. 1 TL-2023]